MADYVAVPDNTLSKGKPWTFRLARIFRDNLLAVLQGAPGAPRVMVSAIGGFSPGTVLLHRNLDGIIVQNNSGLETCKSTLVPYDGTYTVKAAYTIKNGFFGNAQFFAGDTPIGSLQSITGPGELVADISIAAGQLLTVRANNGNGGTAAAMVFSDLRIFANVPKDFTTQL